MKGASTKSSTCKYSSGGVLVVDLLVTVVEIKGECPVYEKGDHFTIVQGYKLKAPKLLCMHSLTSLMPWYVALSKGVSPKSLHLGSEELAHIQCPDPGEYTGGGKVVFAIRRL